MAKFSKKRGKTSPAVSTASLPDIIFMLLFFFMVVTVLRDAELKVKVTTPYATELTKLEEKSLVNYLYIGKPVERYRELYGTKPRIQLGDKFANLNDIPLFLERHKIKVPEARHGQITSSLRVDGEVTMGIVQDVKTQLRKSGQLKVNYSARKDPKRKGSGVASE
ncbi:MAG: biopolymer transporter ExbD [Phaeodactylibacter sp.]|nr:biopolymer transporter ExbD [Phaeodactylibacter sp.]MCB9302817.1 biopolymer transporter ExbD [Lewinellaceae bacterium]HQU58901.1 biopolymer transporter ExbD [Saprospiraceae bacterium]